MGAAERDTLIALIEQGPCWDGDVPSKAGRDALIANGLAIRCVSVGSDGYTAATYKGRDAYKALFPGSSTIAEAMIRRGVVRKRHRCGWTETSDGFWDTGCGHVFGFNAGGPHENTFKFCCFCGEPLAPEPYNPDTVEEETT